MQKSRLSSIVESQEQELGVLVEQSKGGQDVPDCTELSAERQEQRRIVCMLHTPVDHPHLEG